MLFKETEMTLLKKDTEAAAPQPRSEEATYRITMTLRENDVRRAEFLENVLEARSKADAISQAMGIAELVLLAMAHGREVILRTPGEDTVDRIVLPKINQSAAAAYTH